MIVGRMNVLLMTAVCLPLLSTVAFANTCVSSGTGNWNDASKWTGCGSSVPGNGDSVTIGNGHTITIPAGYHAIAGVSGAAGAQHSAGGPVAAVACASNSGTGILAVNGTLTFRGNVEQCSAVWTVGPDAVLEHDSSLASSPSATHYRWVIGAALYPDAAVLQIRGTSGHRAIIRNATSSGTFYGFDYSFDQPWGSGQFDFAYVNIAGCGGTTPCTNMMNHTSAIGKCDHCNVTSSGYMGSGYGGTTSFTNSTFTATADPNHMNIRIIQGGPVTLDTLYIGTGQIMLSGAVNSNFTQTHVRNIVLIADWGGYPLDNGGASFRVAEFDLVARITPAVGGGSIGAWAYLPGGTLTRVMCLINSNSNPHCFMGPTGDGTNDDVVDGGYIEKLGTGDDGDGFLGANGGMNTLTTIKNVVEVCSTTDGFATSLSSNAIGPSGYMKRFSLQNNTYCGKNDSGLDSRGFGYESGSGNMTDPAPTGMLASAQNNIVFAATPSTAYLVHKGPTGVDSAGTYQNVDYNWKWNVSSGPYLGAPGTAYSPNPPGAHDSTGDPQFVQQRHFLEWGQMLDPSISSWSDIVARFAKMNDDSGYDSRFNLADAYDWLRDGYRPRNAAVMTAGASGGRVGAMDAPDNTASLSHAPIGFGPGSLSIGLLDLFDWYGATASGCTAGSREMCVGHAPAGDTQFYSAWFANASLLPVTTGLPVVGSLNDFTAKTCSGNLMVTQLAAFDWSARTASKIAEINCMSSFGTSPSAGDAPAGWKDHCTSGDDGSLGCGWKSRTPFVRDGLLYLPVERQISSGTTSVHDVTMVVSADGGRTWKNPYTVAHSGAASATGDAPTCGAASSASGSPCTDASYPGSIMWQAMPLALSQWEVVQYGQDGVTPPSGINDGCDPATYTCFLAGEQEMTIARVLNTDLPSLDVTKYQYYTCPTITDTYRCPGSAPSSWTSTFANRTSVARMLIPSAGSFLPWNAMFGVAYVKEFKSYLMAGYQNRGSNGTAATFAWAPTIQGPWTPIVSVPASDSALPTTKVWPGFMSPSLALGYTVVGSSPPHVKLTTVQDSPYHTSQTTPFFGQWDLVLGRTPMLYGGGNAHYSNVYGYGTNAGFLFSDSHAAGTFPRKDLAWAFDFYDHAGDTTALGTNGFHEIGNGSAYLIPCAGTSGCWNFLPGGGTNLHTFGASTVGLGYGAQLISARHETPDTIAAGISHTATNGYTLQNAPAATQGNGTFTVAGVFRYDSPGTGGWTPLWFVGDSSGTNTAVALHFDGTSGANLSLGWGGSLQHHYRFNSGFSLVPGKWYFIACTVQANGSSPIGHMWVGDGASLTDKIAGISRTATGGSPTATPAVAAGPLSMGTEPGSPYTANASFAGLFIYNRALGQAEIGLMYQTAKAKMAARGESIR